MFRSKYKKLLLLTLASALAGGSWLAAAKLKEAVEAASARIAMAGQRAAASLHRAEDAGADLLHTAASTQTNFLVVGMDDAFAGSDVIMLASLDSTEGSLRIVQLPRDTYINRQGSSQHKLNTVFAGAFAQAKKAGQSKEEATHTAARGLVAFLQTNLGVPIDHYVAIGTGGLRAIVDAVGGVTVNIPTAIHYDDESQNLHIHLSAGTQVLDGQKAEQFVRFRSGYLTADYGRMDAQKIFLSALFHKIKSEFSLTAATRLAISCFRHTESDLGLADLVPLVRGGLQVSEENVKMITLKGQSAKDENGVLCEVISRRYAIDLLTDYLLPRGASAKELAFDPHGVFTAPGEIGKLYEGESPFGRAGVTADDSDQIVIR